MKNALFVICILCPCIVIGQAKVSTAPMRFDMDASAMPSNINYIIGSLGFSDVDGDQTIGANEQSAIHLKITNIGDGDGHGCEARIKATGTADGITCLPVTLPRIKKGDTIEVSFPIVTNHYTKNGTAHFALEIYEPNGLGTGEIYLDVPTHQFDAPKIEVGQYIVNSDKLELLRKEKFILKIPVQNLAQGTAEKVKVAIKLPSGITLLSNNNLVDIPSMKPNEAHVISYEMIASVNAPELLDFDIVVNEKYGKYAKGKHIQLRLGEKTTIASAITSKRGDDVEIVPLSLVSDVDVNIPVNKLSAMNIFVLIIANEHYQRVAPVPFAINDGTIFREYCIKTLGIQEKRIHYIADATYNQIKADVKWLQTICETFDDTQVIVYYAGHGIPEESSKTAYLLPVDGSGTDASTGYKLDDLYAALGNMPASQIMVFMDACFSGSKREDGMLASARGVALKAKSGVPQGNMVVFSAAQGDETAYPNREKQHGLFTYYLLKKLQQTEGDVSLQELGNYIITNVKQQSVLLNSKLQTPCVTPSATLDASWQNWKLK